MLRQFVSIIKDHFRWCGKKKMSYNVERAVGCWRPPMCLRIEEDKGAAYHAWISAPYLRSFPCATLSLLYMQREAFIHYAPLSSSFWGKHVCIYMLCFPASSSQPLPSLTPTHYKNLPRIQLVKGDFFLPSGCSVAQILLACLHTLAGALRPPLSPSSFSPPPTSWQQKQKGNLQNHNVSCLCQCGLRGRITAHSSPTRQRGLYFNKFTYYRRLCKRLLWGALCWVALGTPSPWLA